MGEAVDRFVREVEVLASLKHPAVVQVLTYGFGPADPDELSLVRAHRGNGSGIITSVN